MDEKAFCFIICTNDILWFEECVRYINRLYIPEGYTINLLGIEEAESMAGGYNEGMQASNAKYKIYMHHDVFIVNRYFLYDILKIFDSDENISLIGIVGTQKMAADGMMWHNPREGALYGFNNVSLPYEEYQYDLEDGLYDVVAVDGLLIATSKDVKWREDLFTGWDFYDVSSGFEHRKRGYRVVVPEQKNPWVVHDDGMMNLWNYDKSRRIFLREYQDMLDDDLSSV